MGAGDKPSDLDVGDDLQDFKRRVDRLLDDLDKSAASHKQIAHQAVSKEAYGKLEDAVRLSEEYDSVHRRLELLSRMLGDQLEAMGIAVDMADRGYKNVDREHAERLSAIQKRSRENWEQQQKLQEEWKRKHQQGAGTPVGDPGKGGERESSDTGAK
ncbi:hypothetical protein ACSNOK_16990 [Streptomyces sp. URMC 126]|uniref:hypothetical protein n=1 Tax=Streptomyces sp. URMC 126 TaxID=3423401 RepID=UPI003F1C1FF4